MTEYQTFKLLTNFWLFLGPKVSKPGEFQNVAMLFPELKEKAKMPDAK